MLDAAHDLCTAAYQGVQVGAGQRPFDWRDVTRLPDEVLSPIIAYSTI